MKVIQYDLYRKTNIGSEAQPVWHEYRNAVELEYNSENLAIAEKEACGGKYSIIEKEVSAPPTIEDRITAIEYAILELMGVNRNG